MGMRAILLSFVFATLPLGASAQDEPKGNPTSGKRLFDVMGCGSCHGYEGQGSRDGPKLNPPPAFPVMLLQLRMPRDLMPPYRENLLSDQQAADLQAHMLSFPKPADPNTIRILREN
jgi:mono/diheme cytochrome c family protein